MATGRSMYPIFSFLLQDHLSYKIVSLQHSGVTWFVKPANYICFGTPVGFFWFCKPVSFVRFDRLVWFVYCSLVSVWSGKPGFSSFGELHLFWYTGSFKFFLTTWFFGKSGELIYFCILSCHWHLWIPAQLKYKNSIIYACLHDRAHDGDSSLKVRWPGLSKVLTAPMFAITVPQLYSGDTCRTAVQCTAVVQTGWDCARRSCSMLAKRCNKERLCLLSRMGQCPLFYDCWQYWYIGDLRGPQQTKS
jgi:hypothetical protein